MVRAVAAAPREERTTVMCTWPAIPTPDPARSVLALAPPEAAAGFWAGGPSACLDGDDVLLAYRLRRPVGDGRGYAVGVARWAGGAHAGAAAVPDLVTEVVLAREDFRSDSLERPALRRGPDGELLLWVSGNTPASAHWRIDLLRARTPAGFRASAATTVLTGVPSGPGPARTAVKDPVVLHHGGSWWMWACVHPLDDPGATDRHWTDLLRSADGASWEHLRTVLAPRPGRWDARGTRAAAAAVGAGGEVVLAYDGRATAGQNYAEQTGFAAGPLDGVLTSCDDDGPAAASPVGDGALRYLEMVALPDGSTRLFYEVGRADGAHELRTELVTAGA